MKKAIITAVVLCTLGAGVALTQGTSNPHGKLAWDCTDCHATSSWQKLRPDLNFEHAKTGFRLDGAHGSATCVGCHRELTFSHVGTACADCHADHHQGQLGTDCAQCHTARDWKPQTDVLRRHAEAGFPLTGVHAVADCETCHLARERVEFTGTPSNCEACHHGDALRATDPDHTQLAFSGECERCHRAAFGSWTRNLYEHPASFALAGAHRNLKCSQCHATIFTGTPDQCYDCHEAVYTATTNPAHVPAGFSTLCQDCHSQVAWVPATFDHAATAFPLVGRHQSTACNQCHEAGYAGTPTICFSCHQTQYDATTAPDHLAAGIPTECQTCHTEFGWQPATFDHAATAFPLVGRHQSTACNQCHQAGYAGTPTACYSCHQAQYEATTDPNHLSAAFPTDCQTCHTEFGWQPATWDHDGPYFPIYSGAHNARWRDCFECHNAPGDFKQFDCTQCHEHSQPLMDDKHSGERDYVFLSSACYSCHPRGRT